MGALIENVNKKPLDVEDLEKVNPFDLLDEIENVMSQFDKVEWLIANWTQEYSFHKKPTLDKSDKDGYDNATKIVWEYKNVFNTIDIAFDYIIQIKEQLAKIDELGSKVWKKTQYLEEKLEQTKASESESLAC